MKRIILGALDYGLAFGINRTLRDLLEDARLSAIGCIVVADLWSREYKPLLETADKVGKRGLIGLNIVLTGDQFTPLSERMHTTYGGKMFARFHMDRRARLRLLPDEIIKDEIKAQLAAFTQKMGFEPSFVTIREGLLERSVILRLLLDAIDELGFKTKPDLLSPVRAGPQASRLKRIAGERGHQMLPWGAPLPEIPEADDLLGRLRTFFNGMPDGIFIPCLPGVADDRLRREEPLSKILIRECQYTVLSSERFFRILMEKDVFLF
ncbi:MAG: ChbG/HpnK family deacetylase [Rhodobacteraceae bacterium]|nr:ChbG/HpnK family deacetylase [Paracoccaceae bacterium]